MKAQKILLPIVAVLGAIVFFSVFIVKEVNQAIVLQFGDPKKIIIEPGLNFKFPFIQNVVCLLYTSPSPRDMRRSRMPSSA